ncbi:TIGR03943 family putative permease subunit [Nocardia xishanensis]
MAVARSRRRFAAHRPARVGRRSCRYQLACQGPAARFGCGRNPKQWPFPPLPKDLEPQHPDTPDADLARVVITCCVADARYVLVHLAGMPEVIEDDAWLEVRGVIEPDSAQRVSARLLLGRVAQSLSSTTAGFSRDSLEAGRCVTHRPHFGRTSYSKPAGYSPGRRPSQRAVRHRHRWLSAQPT